MDEDDFQKLLARRDMMSTGLKVKHNQMELIMEGPPNITLGTETWDISGKGKHIVKNKDTGEEWVIERNDMELVIHSYKPPDNVSDRVSQLVSIVLRLTTALLDEGAMQEYR